ncbi:3669_t:CDS:2, partial [Cetraspora pellucida]
FRSENDKNNTDGLYSENCQNDADSIFPLEKDETEMKLNQYARATGFTLCQKRLELNGDGIIRHRTFECSFSGTPTSNQIIDLTQQCQQQSRKIMCPWHINLTNPKSLSEIKVTSIVRDHNHDMIFDIRLYAPKYHKLAEKIKERIRFHVTKGNMELKQIYLLLVASFPDQYIYKRDLYNKVQKIKAPLTKWHKDAQNIINKLFALKDQEPRWIIYTRIDLFDNRLCFTAGILSTQKVEVMNQLIKNGTSSMSSLCNLHDQVQNLLDDEATWARHNMYLQSLPTNQAPSIIESLFPEARNISKETINNIKDSNNEPLTADLHIFNKLRVSDTFIYEVRQHVQRKAKYAYGFGKMKKALNLVLDLDCEEEFINMRIKSVSETNICCVNSKSSAINPVNPNLYVQQHTPQVASSRTSFHALNSDNSKRNICVLSDNINVNIQVIDDNMLKQ